MCPPWGTPLVSPWRISRTPECPFVCTICGGLYSPLVLLACVSLFLWVRTLAAAPFQRTGCPSFVRKLHPPPVPHSHEWSIKSWVQNISKLTLFFRETQLENRIGSRTRGADVRRTTFDHFCQIFRFFLEFGAHERRWRFLYSKTWQLYKVELSFPERYAQFLMNFRQYFSKWSFWTQNQRGYPLPKFDFRPIFHFGMVWGGKCDFGMGTL